MPRDRFPVSYLHWVCPKRVQLRLLLPVAKEFSLALVEGETEILRPWQLGFAAQCGKGPSSEARALSA